MLNKIKGSVMVRLVLIGSLTLTLLIPLIKVSDLVSERKARRDEAVREISSKWGGRQYIAGPVLVIPYKYVTGWTKKRRPIMGVKNAYLFPEILDVKGNLEAQRRKRGIYNAVLYDANLELSGYFRIPHYARGGILARAIPGRAYIIVSISDTRSIQSSIKLDWQNSKRSFLPGINGAELFNSGIHSPVGLNRLVRGERINFNFPLRVNGSSELRFLPLGKTTAVSLASNWSDPGFQGAYLPAKREIDDKGFKASWDISYFGRNFPQLLVEDIQETTKIFPSKYFGVDLVMTVDRYQKATRAVKYGLLFLSLTFICYFMFEIFSRLKMHPVQYLMVGSAMIIFYVLFISLAEHLTFKLAFLTASLSTIGLLTFYSAKILDGKKRALVLGGMFSGLYGYLYMVLTSEDYALLMGAVLLFALIAAAMFLTRNINWYELKLGEKSGSDDSKMPETVEGISDTV